jgi:hypothetical protein
MSVGAIATGVPARAVDEVHAHNALCGGSFCACPVRSGLLRMLASPRVVAAGGAVSRNGRRSPQPGAARGMLAPGCGRVCARAQCIARQLIRAGRGSAPRDVRAAGNRATAAAQCGRRPRDVSLARASAPVGGATWLAHACEQTLVRRTFAARCPGEVDQAGWSARWSDAPPRDRGRRKPRRSVVSDRRRHGRKEGRPMYAPPCIGRGTNPPVGPRREICSGVEFLTADLHGGLLHNAGKADPRSATVAARGSTR